MKRGFSVVVVGEGDEEDGAVLEEVEGGAVVGEDSGFKPCEVEGVEVRLLGFLARAVETLT